MVFPSSSVAHHHGLIVPSDANAKEHRFYVLKNVSYILLMLLILLYVNLVYMYCM